MRLFFCFYLFGLVFFFLEMKARDWFCCELTLNLDVNNRNNQQRHPGQGTVMEDTRSRVSKMELKLGI